MAYTKALYEIVDEVRKSKNVKIKADILQQNESTALIDLLQLTYNPSIKWLLPEGDPPYVPAEGTNEEGDGTDLEGALIGQMRMMKYFISVDGNEDTKFIREFVDNRFLAIDSRAFRKYVEKIQPDVNLKFYREGGPEGGFDIPIGIGFLWPDAGL